MRLLRRRVHDRRQCYGCNVRKTQDKQDCSNSRTITREKLEARALARLRKGPMTESFPRKLATEVDRLMAKSPDDATLARAKNETRLKQPEATIDRRLDRLESDDASESLMSRLKTREAERDALRLELADQATPRTLKELECIYHGQVEGLLTGSDRMVMAHGRLRRRVPRCRI